MPELPVPPGSTGSGSSRIIGLDYGSVRIGIAVSDPLLIIARGLGVIENTPRAISTIGETVAEYSAQRIVIGMPFNLKGEIAMKAREVNEFILRLQSTLGIEVIPWDERFTSKQAQQTLHQMGVGKKKRQEKGIIDAMAAALILQSYLDSLSR